MFCLPAGEVLNEFKYSYVNAIQVFYKAIYTGETLGLQFATIFNFSEVLFIYSLNLSLQFVSKL